MPPAAKSSAISPSQLSCALTDLAGALALGLAAGATLTDAARVANRAAGIVVGEFGPATVTLEELRRI
jgi:bifunctional ADP-heptose synthase (sugar kinase/adenylyltransferase)